jgi:hypothetical protein
MSGGHLFADCCQLPAGPSLLWAPLLWAWRPKPQGTSYSIRSAAGNWQLDWRELTACLWLVVGHQLVTCNALGGMVRPGMLYGLRVIICNAKHNSDLDSIADCDWDWDWDYRLRAGYGHCPIAGGCGTVAGTGTGNW